MAQVSDYDTVAQAIRFLKKEFRSQPSLEDVARHVGLSPFHFQRLFSRWAGVSPKRFLQFLTVEHAKDRLRQSQAVLSAALEVGLSGPARLHDLFVTTEGVTPGEFKNLGDHVEVQWGIHPSRFGLMLLGATDRGICHLAFLDSGDADGSRAHTELERSWPRARFTRSQDATRNLVDLIFRSGTSHQPRGPLYLFLKGTNFQLRVWNALLRIPPGHLSTYGRLAAALGSPRAARAVGAAVGRNPVGYLIPCHRVIREEGDLGGYRWGVDRKAAILGWESAHQIS